MNNKGAIELSINFIVVMIISMVILAGGLGLFFKLKNNAQDFADKVDSQTDARLKSIMLKNSYKLAVYPQDPEINVKNPATVYLGITNIFPVDTTFTIELTKVEYYKDDTSLGQQISGGSNDPNYITITQNPPIRIGPNSQLVKGMLLKLPAGTNSKGQYVYTIQVTYIDQSGYQQTYDIVQVYATN